VRAGGFRREAYVTVNIATAFHIIDERDYSVRRGKTTSSRVVRPAVALCAAARALQIYDISYNPARVNRRRIRCWTI